MKSRIIALFTAFTFLFFGLNSCKQVNEEKFERIAWKTKSDPAFPPPMRSAMVRDLTTTHKLVGLKYTQLIDKLGNPEFMKDFSLGYTIELEYGSDIDPVYSKDLIFHLSKDSIVTSFEVKEWKK